MYSLLIALYENNVYRSPWITFVKSKLDDLGLSYLWYQQNVENQEQFKQLVKTRLNDQYLQTWATRINESPKCDFYKCIKHSIELEAYLNLLPYNLRKNMARFRLSNHKLPVEKLRHTGVERSERYCNKCLCNYVGDELHVLLDCNNFKQERELYLGKNFRKATAEQTVYYLFNCNDNNIMYNLAKFVSCIMKEFDEKL